jgi:hypothetical protein
VFFGDVGDVVGRRVEAGDQAAGVALVGGGVAGGRGGTGAMICAGSGVEQWLVVVGCDLGDRGELRLRCVDGQDVARAGARVVRIADAEAAADAVLGSTA